MLIYFVAKLISGLILKIGRMRILGNENIPQKEAFIIISNHTSFWDPPVLSQAFKKPITYIAKEEFAKNILTRFFFGAMGAVFLKKKESDLSALRYAINKLKQKQLIAIFPEGHRNYDQKISKFKSGASYIAQRTKCRILPVAMINTGDFWHFWRQNIIVNIGETISVKKEADSSQHLLNEYNTLLAEKVEELFNINKNILLKENKKIIGMSY